MPTTMLMKKGCVHLTQFLLAIFFLLRIGDIRCCAARVCDFLPIEFESENVTAVRKCSYAHECVYALASSRVFFVCVIFMFGTFVGESVNRPLLKTDLHVLSTTGVIVMKTALTNTSD